MAVLMEVSILVGGGGMRWEFRRTRAGVEQEEKEREEQEAGVLKGWEAGKLIFIKIWSV